MTDMVKVACRVPNGISIRRFKHGYDDGTGYKPMIPDGLPVFLPGPSSLHTGVGNTSADADPVVSEVDAEWWAAWLEENKLNPLVTSEQVCLLREEEHAPNPTA